MPPPISVDEEDLRRRHVRPSPAQLGDEVDEEVRLAEREERVDVGRRGERDGAGEGGDELQRERGVSGCASRLEVRFERGTHLELGIGEDGEHGDALVAVAVAERDVDAGDRVEAGESEPVEVLAVDGQRERVCWR